MLPPAFVCQSGVSGAWKAGALRAPMPIMIGTPKAAIARVTFFAGFSPATLRFLMMASIRVLAKLPEPESIHDFF